MKKLMVIGSSLILFLLSATAQETLTITTYYPAPYGVYNELRANKMVFGDPDSSSTPVPDTNGVVRFKGRRSDPSGVNDTQPGALYYNWREKKFKYYDGSGWKGLGGISDFVIVQNKRDLGGGSYGVTASCPTGYIRIACSGGMDWDGTSFWDSGDEEDKGYNGAAPVGTNSCTAFADGGVNIYVWAYCVKE